MSIVREPQVHLIAHQSIDHTQIQKFLDKHGVGDWATDAEHPNDMLCEMAGRVCYMSFARPRPGGNQTYLSNIIQSGHGSVLEHAVWTFLIAGVSRTMTHELVRHRAGFSYSQLSQRYVDESTADFIEPDCIATDPQAHAIFERAVADAHEAYKKLVDILNVRFQNEPDVTLRRKMARQAARCVLPNATETKIVVTANARAWRHFIELRASVHAEVEIRKVAIAILRLLQQHDKSNIFNDYTITPLPDGTFVASTINRKV